MNVRESLTTLGIDGIVLPAALSLTPPLTGVNIVLFSSRTNPRAIHSKLHIFSWLFNTYAESWVTKFDNDYSYNYGDKPKFVGYIEKLKRPMDSLTSEQVIVFLQTTFDKPCTDWYDNEKKTQTPLPREVCKKMLLIYVLEIE